MPGYVGIDECLKFVVGSGSTEKIVYYLDDDVKKALDALSYGRLIVLFQACVGANGTCFSGGFIDDLSASNRIIMTSANETYKSYGDWDDDGFSEFCGGFIDALHGNDTTWSDSQLIVDVGIVPANERDPNGNGHVSMLEAFNYAKSHDVAYPATDQPWYDDDGDRLPTFINETDVLDDNQGNLGAQAYLDWLVGDISEDGLVDIVDLIMLWTAWGSSPSANGSYVHTPPCGFCPHSPLADMNLDSVVDIDDLLMLINRWAEYFPSVLEGSGGGDEFVDILSEGPLISVGPAQTTVYVYDVFQVNVTVNDVTGLYGWEFKLYWNPAILNCTSAQIRIPQIWTEGYTKAGPEIVQSEGIYFVGVCPNGDMPPFNTTQTFTLVTFTFKALQAEGTYSLSLRDTKLVDKHAIKMSHTSADGSVTVQMHRRYMRGDTHTINGLNAYKLGTSQSAIAKYVKQTVEIYGLSAQWGIKVWKRTAGGTETEVSSGFVAVVTRTGQGEGLQSATWNCPQTSLNPTDTIIIRVYQEIEDYAWQLAATFTTEQLATTQLDNTLWTVYYYTKLAWICIPKYGIEKTEATFYWGTTTYNSYIKNFEYT